MLTTAQLRLGLAFAAVSLLCSAAPRAADAAERPRTCGSPALSSRILETPSFMLTYAELARERRRSDDIRTRACWRGNRRPHALGSTYDVNLVSGGVTPLRLLGGRWLLVEDWESSLTDEGSQYSASRRLFDARTNRSTAPSGSNAAVGLPGLLATAGGRLVLRAPGRAQRTVATAPGAVALALGETTAYWTDRAGAVSAATVPQQLPPVEEPQGRPSPARAAGPCEPAGSRTVVRLAGGRIYETAGGSAFACSRASRRTIALAELRDSTTVLSERHVAIAQQTPEGTMRYLVLDLPNARVLHVAAVEGERRGVVPTADGILMADDRGVRWVAGRRARRIADAAGSDHAVAEPTEERAARAYWTTPTGPRSFELP